MATTYAKGVIAVADRPYLLTFHATGATYPLTANDVRRLLEEYPVLKVTRNRLLLPGHNTSRASERCTIRAATLGGGPAFTR